MSCWSAVLSLLAVEVTGLGLGGSVAEAGRGAPRSRDETTASMSLGVPSLAQRVGRVLGVVLCRVGRTSAERRSCPRRSGRVEPPPTERGVDEPQASGPAEDDEQSGRASDLRGEHLGLPTFGGVAPLCPPRPRDVTSRSGGSVPEGRPRRQRHLEEPGQQPQVLRRAPPRSTPSDARCGVCHWVSTSRSSPSSSSSTSPTSAAFEASVSWWNIDSPANRPPIGDAVQPAHEAPVAPGLHRVHPAQLVEAEVRRTDLVVDPARRPRRVRAGVDHLRAGGVDPDLEAAHGPGAATGDPAGRAGRSTPRRTGLNHAIGARGPPTGIGNNPCR